MSYVNNASVTVSPQHGWPMIAAWGSVTLSLCSLLGALGNIILCISIYRSAQMSHAYMKWIFLMGLADGLFCIYSPWQEVLMVMHYKFHQGEESLTSYCRVQNVLHTILALGSPSAQAAMAINRLLCIFTPQLYTRYLTSRRNIVMQWVLSNLVLPGLFAVPAGVGWWGNYRVNQGSGMCMWDVAAITWKRTCEIVFMYVPVCIMLLVYPLIYTRIVWFRQTPNEQSKTRCVTMFFVRSLVYAVMVGPCIVIETRGGGFYEAYPSMVLWLLTLYWLTMASNPLVYALVNTEVRDAVYALFGIRKKAPAVEKRKRNPMPQTTTLLQFDEKLQRFCGRKADPSISDGGISSSVPRNYYIDYRSNENGSALPLYSISLFDSHAEAEMYEGEVTSI